MEDDGVVNIIHIEDELYDYLVKNNEQSNYALQMFIIRHADKKFLSTPLLKLMKTRYVITKNSIDTGLSFIIPFL